MEQLIQQIANGLVLGSTYSVVALGFALVFSVMRVVNLAHPDIAMAGMFIAVVVASSVSSAAAVVVLLVLVGTALIGLGLERAVLRPLRGREILMPMIATAGVSTMFQYGAAGIFSDAPRAFPGLLSSTQVEISGIALSTLQLVNVGVAILVLAAVLYYVHGTRWGLATRAIAERPTLTAAFGVDINRVGQITVVLASVLAGVAALSIGSLFGTAWAFVGNLYVLKSFVCMLVAGNKRLEGVMAVGLLLGVLEALVTAYVSSSLRDAVAFVLLIGVLFFRPNGLFGSYEVDE